MIAAVAICRAHRAPVLSRGAGTSLAGQCCNVAVVLDFTKYMNRILEIDPVQRIARVQPGVVLDTLRNAAEVHKLTFGPDPSTHSRCTLGGMIGNNSCGTHSLLAGKTVDNVEELDILLYDGTRLTVGATEAAAIDAVIRGGGRRGEIYSAPSGHSRPVRRSHPRALPTHSAARVRLQPRRIAAGERLSRRPRARRKRRHVRNRARGTAQVDSEPAAPGAGRPGIPRTRSKPPITFRRFFEFNPIGLEGFEGSMVDGLRKKGAPHLELVPEGRGYLLVEFGFDDAAEAARAATRFLEWVRALPDAPDARLYSSAEAKAMWRIREAGPRAAATAPGAPLEWEGWDDAAVAPEKLGAYLRDLRTLLDEYQYRTGVLRAFRPRLHPHAGQLRSGDRGWHPQVRRVRRSRGRPGRAATAGRSPGSTATARRAARCFRRCSATS